jgi:PAS domain S-box-containing protein
MKDNSKTKQQLVDELTVLRRRIARLEKTKLQLERMPASPGKREDGREQKVQDISHRLLTEEIEKRKKTEDALRASEARYKSVIDHIGIGVALISPRMEILTLNYQMREWFPHVDPSKKPLCYEAFNDPPKKEVCSYCPTFKTLQDGKTHESMTETPAGKAIRNYRIVSTPIRDHKGGIEAAIEMVEDMTERYKLQEQIRESEKRYRTIFETTASATMIIEEDTTVSLVNRTFEEKIGYSRKDVEGKKSWTEFIPAEDVAQIRKYHDARRTDPGSIPENYEARFLDSEGNIRDVLVTAAMIPGTRTSIASLLDITERKNAERALKEREQELEAQSRMLEEVNTALRVLLKQRDEDKKELEEKLLTNVKELVMPYFEKLNKTSRTPEQIACLGILETNLNDIISPFLKNITLTHSDLTPREIQIANLIKNGKTTKDIAELLNVSTRAIEFHRDNIRIKLKLKNKKTNLRSYLLTHF